MVSIAELFALSKAYPIISIIIGMVLFFVGLKTASVLLKWIFWILAVVAIIVAVWMIFA